MLQRTNTAGNGINKSPPRVRDYDRKSHGRSKVSNGSCLFAEHVDGRSTWARRFRDLVALHVADLGGPAGLSEAQRSLIRRVVTLEVEMERLECKFAKDSGGSNRMLDRYLRMANNLRRFLITLGLECKGS